MKKHVVIREQQVLGAYDRETLLALLNGGTLKLTDSYWDAERSEWRRVVDFLGEEKARRFRWRLAGGIAVAAALAAGVLAVVLQRQRDAGGAAPPAAASPAVTAPAAPASPEPALNPPVPPPAAPPPSAVILHVEDYEREVAVTIQNNSAEPLGKVKLLLEYYWLPGAQLRLNQIEAQSLAAEREAEDARKQAATVRRERIVPLRSLLDLLGQDAAAWSPAQHQSLPRADGWAALGDEPLAKAGRALSGASKAFVTRIESSDPEARRQALSVHLPALIELAGNIKPLAAERLTGAENEEKRLLAAVLNAGKRIQDIEAERAGLQASLDAALIEARKVAAQKETIETEAGIAPGLVKRLLVPRAKHERMGVTARIAGGD